MGICHFLCFSGIITELIQVEDPGPGFEELLPRLPELVVASRSRSTASKYTGYFRRWTRFIQGRGHSSLPARGIHVALFIIHLLDKGLSSTSILSFVYSIKWVHKLNGYEDPTTHVHVINLIETSKRVSRRPRNKKDHVSAEVVNDLFKQFGSSTDPLLIRDLCMIILSFSCFLRFNELNNLLCSDVTIFDDHFSLNISKSKTDQYRYGNQVVCSKLGGLACPYTALCKYVKSSSIDTKSGCFLFRPMFRSGKLCKLITKNKKLSYTRVKETLLNRVHSITGNKGNFGLHSFRAGGATAAANSHVVDRCWKRHGRWASDAAKDGYVADSLSNRLTVSQNLGLF